MHNTITIEQTKRHISALRTLVVTIVYSLPLLLISDILIAADEKIPYRLTFDQVARPDSKYKFVYGDPSHIHITGVGTRKEILPRKIESPIYKSSTDKFDTTVDTGDSILKHFLPVHAAKAIYKGAIRHREKTVTNYSKGRTQVTETIVKLDRGEVRKIQTFKPGIRVFGLGFKDEHTLQYIVRDAVFNRQDAHQVLEYLKTQGHDEHAYQGYNMFTWGYRGRGVREANELNLSRLFLFTEDYRPSSSGRFLSRGICIVFTDQKIFDGEPDEWGPYVTLVDSFLGTCRGNYMTNFFYSLTSQLTYKGNNPEGEDVQLQIKILAQSTDRTNHLWIDPVVPRETFEVLPSYGTLKIGDSEEEIIYKNIACPLDWNIYRRGIGCRDEKFFFLTSGGKIILPGPFEKLRGAPAPPRPIRKALIITPIEDREIPPLPIYDDISFYRNHIYLRNDIMDRWLHNHISKVLYKSENIGSVVEVFMTENLLMLTNSRD